MLLARFLKSVFRRGELTLIDAAGRTHRFGDPRRGPAVTIRLHDRSLHFKLWLRPRLYLGEAYMDGSLTVEQGSIYDFLDLAGLNVGEGTLNAWDRWVLRARHMWRGFEQANPLGRAQKHVAHHYDLSDELYALFLDSDRQYSCGYFATRDTTLEEAQEAKKRHIAAKLRLQPGQKVLDIGSGWGGLALYLARCAGVEVTGITLSKEQHAASQERAAEAGLADRVRFHLRDYREETGTYDRIVSVGMFEHVGTPHYEEYFAKVRELLTDDGVALLHTIAHRDPPTNTNPWLRKYIFPGGYCPALSEVLPVTERVGLWVTDIEILRLHYAETLRHWRRRFVANRDKVVALFDDRFFRMWEFYLAGSEVAFRRQGQMVAQIQMTKSVDAVPLTRDYMIEWEQAHAPVREAAARRLKSVS
ncbi:MAG: class I SAM-dependent methyltransferase [Kiloniellaceae bacterium]